MDSDTAIKVTKAARLPWPLFSESADPFSEEPGQHGDAQDHLSGVPAKGENIYETRQQKKPHPQAFPYVKEKQGDQGKI
ncbi:MAG: hypothetical protein IJT00_10995 [Lachnospiraceae bacterium]|nr:hypothetical protein [Lachnospiraceae bacterium]